MGVPQALALRGGRERGIWYMFAPVVILSCLLIACSGSDATIEGSSPGDATTEQPGPGATEDSAQPLATATLQPIPTATGARPPAATATPSARPTNAASRLGEGEMYSQEGVSIQLLDYEFRTLNQEERAAIAFTLRFINESSTTVLVEFLRSGIAAVDNLNIQYYECSTYDSDRDNTVQLEIPEGSAEVELFLGLDTSYCPSRVDIGTDFVDVDMGTIKVRTDHLIEFTDVEWWLVR